MENFSFFFGSSSALVKKICDECAWKLEPHFESNILKIHQINQETKIKATARISIVLSKIHLLVINDALNIFQDASKPLKIERFQRFADAIKQWITRHFETTIPNARKKAESNLDIRVASLNAISHSQVASEIVTSTANILQNAIMEECILPLIVFLEPNLMKAKLLGVSSQSIMLTENLEYARKRESLKEELNKMRLALAAVQSLSKKE